MICPALKEVRRRVPGGTRTKKRHLRLQKYPERRPSNRGESAREGGLSPPLYSRWWQCWLSDSWYTQRPRTGSHSSEIAGYTKRVGQTAPPERQRILDAAYAYNETLRPGPLTGPYVSLSEDEVNRSAVYLAYEELLRISGTDVIGTVNYPALNIALPVYHGTTDEVISKGAGHMYGTSLPVGGPSTHAVLTAHSGLPSARLFTRLPEAKVGDQFWISVLSEDHYYQVQAVDTVRPGDTESLKIIEGEDWVTLFTCTPIGINSHRFMVHAERIPDPAKDDGNQFVAGDGISAGFPWWAVWFVGGSVLVGWFLFAPPGRKKEKSRADPHRP